MKVVFIDTHLTWSCETMSTPSNSYSSETFNSSSTSAATLAAASSNTGVSPKSSGATSGITQLPSPDTSAEVNFSTGTSSSASSNSKPLTTTMSSETTNGVSVITKNEQPQPPMTAAAVPPYKLVYFNSRGHAEVSRLILQYAQIPFEDIRLNTNEWTYFKTQMPYGKLPLLIFDTNEELNDSKEIAKFLAKRHGLSGKTMLEEIKVDSIIDLRMKFGTEIQAYIALSVGTHPSMDLRQIREKIFNESFLPAINKYSPMLIELLEKNTKKKNNPTSKFFMASGVTVADLAVAELSDTLQNFYSDFEKKFPQLMEHSKIVHGLPELQKYLNERPFSKY